VVLQQGPFIILSENARQNAKKSGYLDFGGIQNISIVGLILINLYYYDLSSELRLHLGKDLRKSKGVW